MLEQILAVLAFISAKWHQNNCETHGSSNLHQNAQFVFLIFFVNRFSSEQRERFIIFDCFEVIVETSESTLEFLSKF